METSEPRVNAGRETTAMASYVQRAMWAAEQRHPRKALNMMMMPWRVRGHLDVPALQLAIDDVVVRHPTLRSCLRYEAGQLLQVTSASAESGLTIEDLSARDPSTRLEAGLSLLRQIAREGLGLANGPLFRPCLLRLGERDHILCLLVHHAMCDAWSSEIIIRELTECYRARLQGAVAELKPIAQQFSDFAREQIDAFDTRGYAVEIAYWRKQLEQLPPAVELPVGGLRKSSRDLAVRSLTTLGTPELLKSLKDTARAGRVSLFALLLAAVSTLVHGRTGSEDFVIAVSTVNRWTPAARDFVGCATSLLPARIRPRPDQSFADLAAQVHQTIRELLAYGRVPLELILRDLHGPVPAGPTFPIWAQLREPAQALVLGLEGLSFLPMTIERAAILCDIEFDFVESPSGIECELAHRAALFEPAVAESMSRDIAELLHAAATYPQRPIGQLLQRGQGKP